MPSFKRSARFRGPISIRRSAWWNASGRSSKHEICLNMWRLRSQAESWVSLPLMPCLGRRSSNSLTHTRGDIRFLFSEAIATFGLVLIISISGRKNVNATPAAVALYITSAYPCTSSTSFANPAVTIARSLTDTFSGHSLDRRSSIHGSTAGRCVGGLRYLSSTHKMRERTICAEAEYLAIDFKNSNPSKRVRVRPLAMRAHALQISLRKAKSPAVTDVK